MLEARPEDQSPKGALSHRLGAIFRHWTETRMILSQFFRGSRLDRADCAFFIAAGILLFLLQVEPLFWSRLDLPADGLAPADTETADPDPVRDLIFQNPLEGFWIFPFGGLTAESTRGFWMIVLAVYLVNAWLFDRWLARTSGEDATIRSPILAVRRLLVGIPWLGLCIYPAWQALLDVRPSWIFRNNSASTLRLDLSPRRVAGVRVLLYPLRIGLDKIGSPTLFTVLWLVPVNMMALRAGLAWLNVPERIGCAQLLLLGFALASLHFLGFA